MCAWPNLLQASGLQSPLPTACKRPQHGFPSSALRAPSPAMVTPLPFTQVQESRVLASKSLHCVLSRRQAQPSLETSLGMPKRHWVNTDSCGLATDSTTTSGGATWRASSLLLGTDEPTVVENTAVKARSTHRHIV